MKTEQELKMNSINDLEQRHFLLSKIILSFNLKDVLIEFFLIKEELRKRYQEQNHDK